MEVYVDDMLVKSKKSSENLVNLEDTLQSLERSQLRINPEKCSFGVTLGKFLGFMITIMQMKAPRSYKEVQQLAGFETSIQRRVHMGRRVCPGLRRIEYLRSPMILTRPKWKEELPTLFGCDKWGSEQYARKRGGLGAEENYPQIDKLVMALVILAR
ncbi:hypothetical protein LIER_12436 [Lithospermum erythrorhizon]|uniref:Reverse transcriptase domain-containing protein n=1 Tax=Lithospermum erythrorhizon TaxID=34254 RepID=A0AAV3PSF8_LITER